MSQLLNLFFDICLFRKGPQDVPASSLLLGLSLVAYAVVGLLLLSTETTLPGALLQVAMEGGMLVGFIYVTLASADLKNRLLQTSIAMLGTDALIRSLAIPILFLSAGMHAVQNAHILLLMLMLWHVSVVAHILRHALSKSYGFAWDSPLSTSSARFNS